MAKVRPLASVRACGALEVASGSMGTSDSQHALRTNHWLDFSPRACSAALTSPVQSVSCRHLREVRTMWPVRLYHVRASINSSGYLNSR